MKAMLSDSNVRGAGRLMRRGGLVSDHSGIAAVEAAFFLAGLGFVVLLLAQFYVVHSNGERMREALRSSAQYVVNGGTDLGRIRSLFTHVYGRDSAVFSSSLVCICPLTVAEFRSADEISIDRQREEDSESEPVDYRTSAGYDQLATRAVLEKADDGGWPQCSNYCPDGQLAQSFAEFSASDSISGGILAGYKDIGADITVRLVR